MKSIEYFMVNIPETLTNIIEDESGALGPSKIMMSLLEYPNIDIFENACIQTIIDFKWQKYTKWYYVIQAIIYLSFFVIFIADLFYSVFYNQRRDFNLVLCLKIVCNAFLFFFLLISLASGFKAGLKWYFKTIWNYIDLFIFVLYLAMTYLEMLKNPDYHIYVRIIFCPLVLLAEVKLTYFLRMLEGFSFQVQMMIGVFYDLRYFVCFYVISITLYGILFAIMKYDTDTDSYSNIGASAYFIQAFRTSTGDFDTESYGDQDDSLVTLTWIIFILAVFVLNIILMNFIIAVISQSYEKIMQKLVA